LSLGHGCLLRASEIDAVLLRVVFPCAAAHRGRAQPRRGPGRCRRAIVRPRAPR